MPPDQQGRQDHQSPGRPQGATRSAPDLETVVLVHGLWMGSWVMSAMGMRLRRCGFHTAFFSYPSMSSSLSRNALYLSGFVASLAASRIHFVGHSLGGLLILQMLAEFPEPRVGRVILAGSPYGACSVGTKLSRRGPGRHILGRSMLQWLDQAGTMHTTHNHPYELGVIAGCRSLGAGRLIARLPVPNDGVVTVEETRIPNVRDEIVLNVSHSQMLVSPEVARQVSAFLEQGHFLHDRDQQQRGHHL